MRAKALKTLYTGYCQKKTGKPVLLALKDEIIRIKKLDGACALCWFENGKIGWVSLSEIKRLEDERV